MPVDQPYVNDFRGAYFDSFVRAMQNPGSPVLLPIRITAADGWTTECVTFVGLLDHDDVRAIVVAVEPTGDVPTVIECRTREVTGEHDRASLAIFSLNDISMTTSVEGDAEALTGRGADELIGKFLIECVYPDSYEKVLAMIKSLLGDPGGTRHLRDRLLHPDEVPRLGRGDPREPAAA